jgi:hypothetical protein
MRDITHSSPACSCNSIMLAAQRDDDMLRTNSPPCAVVRASSQWSHRRRHSMRRHIPMRLACVTIRPCASPVSRLNSTRCGCRSGAGGARRDVSRTRTRSHCRPIILHPRARHDTVVSGGKRGRCFDECTVRLARAAIRQPPRLLRLTEFLRLIRCASCRHASALDVTTTVRDDQSATPQKR